MLTSPIDNILVEKAKRQMHLRNGENIVETYKISLDKVLDFKAVPYTRERHTPTLFKSVQVQSRAFFSFTANQNACEPA